MSTSVLVLGDINVDAFMPIPRYPQPGQEAMGQKLMTELGGSAANTAVVLARLGAAIRLVGRVGFDAWGSLALERLEANGVDTRAVQRDPDHSTGLAFIPALPDGDHVMFCYRGANDYCAADELPANLLREVRLVHLSGYALGYEPQCRAAWQVIELATERQIPLSLDTALEPALRFPEEMRALVPRLDLCVLGMQEGQALTRAETVEGVVDALLGAGVKRVGLKLGREGCIVAGAEGRQRQPACAVTTVDTTGAGDAFSAGLITSYLLGLDLAASAQLAAALGALATTVWGGGAALPDGAEFTRALGALVPGVRAIRNW